MIEDLKCHQETSHAFFFIYFCFYLLIIKSFVLILYLFVHTDL